jgi:eukaryotic-like serine/threonine-protein kinase
MMVEPGQVKGIFLHAVENCAPGEWGTYVDQACGENAELRRRVMMLLDAHQSVDSLIDTPEPKAPEGPSSFGPLQAGTMIGPYKLLQPIGEGGMGTVYMAEQTVPVRRTVALKLIKAGMDSRLVLARFGAERQALALMDHPNIAKVHDAGTTDTGRPYFVMELVKGIPITTFCDERRLTLRERLELAIPVCQAVQHAHQKGIIHRDLKPSNVLVALYDGKPVPKIIDFGVAKATGPRLTDQTLYTEFGTVVGTFEYMSPEQAELNQLDIDTRSDIYSLGVLLYELLTGSTPLEHKRIKETVFLEVLRLIREEESPRPSLRLSRTDELPSIAACRDVEPRKLSGLLRGELDWIVMTALEKDRNRRYETANGLAADLRRYLDDEPVQACPPSGRYRFGKFARRHRLGLTLAGLFAAAMLIGVAGLTASIFLISRSYTAERAAHRRAEANFERARGAVDEFFTTVSQSKLLNIPGLQPLRKELLDAAVRYYRALAEERIDDPAVQAGLAVAHFRLTEVNYEVNRNDDAIRELDAGLVLVEQLLQQDPRNSELFRHLPGFWKGTRRMLGLGVMPSDRPAAERALKKFLQIWEKLSSQYPAQPALQSDLATIYNKQSRFLAGAGRPDEAAASYQKGIALWEGLVRAYPNDPEYQAALGEDYDLLAGLLGAGENRRDQVKLMDMALALREKLTASYPDVAQYQEDLAASINAKAAFLLQNGKKIEAEVVYRLVLEIWQKLAAKYPNTYIYHLEASLTLSRLSDLAQSAGRLEEIVQAYSKAIESYPMEARYLLDRSREYGKLGQWNKAQADVSRAVELIGKSVPDDPRLLVHLAHRCRVLAWGLWRTGNLREALNAFRTALQAFETAAAQGPPDFSLLDYQSHTLLQMGRVLRSDGRPEEAEDAFRRALAVSEKIEAIGLIKRLAPSDVIAYYTTLASVLHAAGKAEDAIAASETLLKLAPKNADVHNNLAWWLATFQEPRLRDPARAVELARKAVELAPQDGRFWITLGAAHYRAGDWKAAIEALTRSMELAPGRNESFNTFFLAMAHWQLGDKPQARSWYDKAVPWMEKNQPKDDELIRFRAEAAALLGVKLKKD